MGMKYLMTYESAFNYQVEVMKPDEAYQLYRKLYSRKRRNFNLKDKIHYFDYEDLHIHFMASKEYRDSMIKWFMVIE